MPFPHYLTSSRSCYAVAERWRLHNAGEVGAKSLALQYLRLDRSCPCCLALHLLRLYVCKARTRLISKLSPILAVSKPPTLNLPQHVKPPFVAEGQNSLHHVDSIPSTTIDALHTPATQHGAASSPSSATQPKAAVQTSNLRLRIMALGDSITYGEGSTDGNGYRLPLYNSLTAAGHNVTMVGSRTSGLMAQNAIEAWKGADVEYVSYAANFSLWRRPNIILLHAGSNDLRYSVENPPYFDLTASRLGKLIDQITAACPDAVLFVAKIIQARDVGSLQETVRAYNVGVVKEVHERTAQGKRVVLVNMEDALTISDMIDVAHPNDAGHAKIGAVWYKYITQVISAGLISDPVPEPAFPPPEALKPFPPFKVHKWEDDPAVKAANTAVTGMPTGTPSFATNLSPLPAEPSDTAPGFTLASGPMHANTAILDGVANSAGPVGGGIDTGVPGANLIEDSTAATKFGLTGAAG